MKYDSKMIDKDLEKIRMKKAEALLKGQSLPKNIINIVSNNEFDQVLQNYPDIFIIIDFWASWCGPCMTFAPVFEKLQQEYQNEFIFLKVNVDVHHSIANRYKITGIPTITIIKKGGLVNKIVGAINYDAMKKLLEKLKNS